MKIWIKNTLFGGLTKKIGAHLENSLCSWWVSFTIKPFIICKLQNLIWNGIALDNVLMNRWNWDFINKHLLQLDFYFQKEYTVREVKRYILTVSLNLFSIINFVVEESQYAYFGTKLYVMIYIFFQMYRFKLGLLLKVFLTSSKFWSYNNDWGNCFIF